MFVSIIAGSHLGDFFNILPVVGGVYKMNNKEPIDFVIPVEFNEKFPSLREFLLHQPMFKSVSFSNETQYQGLLIHGYRLKFDKPYPMAIPGETYRAKRNVETDYRIEIKVDEDFELIVPDLNLDFDTTKNLVGERSQHSRRHQRKEYFLKPSGYFDDCLFLDYNDSMTVNAWKIKNCQGVFISTFTGISVMADLMKKRHVVAWDQESVDDCLLDGTSWTVEKMYDRHYFRDRKGQLLPLSTFNWNQVN